MQGRAQRILDDNLENNALAADVIKGRTPVTPPGGLLSSLVGTLLDDKVRTSRKILSTGPSKWPML